jgi:hypothetical protein
VPLPGSIAPKVIASRWLPIITIEFGCSLPFMSPKTSQIFLSSRSNFTCSRAISSPPKCWTNSNIGCHDCGTALPLRPARSVRAVCCVMVSSGIVACRRAATNRPSDEDRIVAGAVVQRQRLNAVTAFRFCAAKHLDGARKRVPAPQALDDEGIGRAVLVAGGRPRRAAMAWVKAENARDYSCV